ncbi:MAG TPA: SDR family NAD(P)-dependent oxidoreductase [Acidimicrobiales bacterium]|nr:SDR family NAD(P)-dependent oxidoreductase [Acidimicrobiales bacterium]
MDDAFGRPQSVVVLGGTSEIAGALVATLAAGRCRTVVLAGRDVDALAGAAGRARAGGASVVETVTFDATDLKSAQDTVDRCFAAAGNQVDLVLVTVGLLNGSRSETTDADRISEVAAANFTWPASAIAFAAERLRAQGSGRIVVFSSVAAVRARPATVLYGSAKAALDRFASGLAQSLRGSGVVVQIVRPGFVHTKMTRGLRPAPFAVGPEDVAAAVMRGIERDQAIIWVPGFLRWLYLVLRHLPRQLWARLPG